MRIPETIIRVVEIPSKAGLNDADLLPWQGMHFTFHQLHSLQFPPSFDFVRFAIRTTAVLIPSNTDCIFHDDGRGCYLLVACATSGTGRKSLKVWFGIHTLIVRYPGT